MQSCPFNAIMLSILALIHNQTMGQMELYTVFYFYFILIMFIVCGEYGKAEFPNVFGFLFMLLTQMEHANGKHTLAHCL